MCEVSNQIAINADEPESDYCPKCESPLTEQYYAGTEWIECDNPQCDYTSEED